MRYDPKTERIVTAWAEKSSGPGWSNQLVWVLVSKRGGVDCRLEAVQPDEQTPEMLAMFEVSATVSREMLRAALRLPHAPAEGDQGVTRFQQLKTNEIRYLLELLSDPMATDKGARALWDELEAEAWDRVGTGDPVAKDIFGEPEEDEA